MKLLLVGCCGRMGKAVASLAEDYGAEITCGVDGAKCPMLFPVYPRIEDVMEKVDAVIDFSSPSALKSTLTYCLNHMLPVLLAATGYSDQQLTRIREAAKTIPVFQTGNLSVGVALLQLLAKKAASVLQDYDAEIIERHHNKKKDAPSGTALMLAKSVNEGFGNSKEFLYGRKGEVGARKKSEIGIHAVRGGTIVGEHEVMFAGDDEIITLSHSARSRNIFASGALRVTAWLITQPHGFYEMNDYIHKILF